MTQAAPPRSDTIARIMPCIDRSWSEAKPVPAGRRRPPYPVFRNWRKEEGGVRRKEGGRTTEFFSTVESSPFLLP